MTAPRIDTFVLGEYQTNCFVVSRPGDDGCWIVDCGFDPDSLLEAIDRAGLNPRAILLTHAHPDHIAGVDAALARYGPLPMYIHEAEKGFCSEPLLNLSAHMGFRVTCTEPDHLLRDGETLDLAGSAWRVLHVPGHSPGCVMFVHDESRQVIAGDTLFAGSIGRIDFPTSDPAAMQRSLRDVIMRLPDDMTVYPGHGPLTTIGDERRHNPYVLGGVA